jgi:hypothetical protein
MFKALGFQQESDFEVFSRSGTISVDWFSATPQPSEQEIDDFSNDLTTTPGGQTWTQWQAENGGDATLTLRRQAKELLDQTQGNEALIRALAFTVLDEVNILRRSGYGGLYRDAAVAVQSVPNNAFTKLAALTGASAMATGGGVTSDTVGGEIVLPRAGHWHVGFHLSFSGSNNTEFEFAAFSNGTKVPEVTSTRALGTGGAAGIGSLSASGIVNAPTDNIAIDLRCGQAELGARDVTVERLQLWAHEITDLASRTPAQLRNSIKAKITAGDADV